MSDTTANLATPAVEQPEAVCSRCGRPDAAKFGDVFICDDCYTACGSCCAEWFEEKQEPETDGALP